MSADDGDEVLDRPRIPAPTSLDAMQELPTEDFNRVERYQWGDYASISRVIDHIIDLAAAELEWRDEENANSLRDFWYNPAKPILGRVFPDTDRLDDRLSQQLSDAVKEGGVSYRELNILDDSRKRDLYTSGAESDRLLFVEKRAAYRKLKPLADVYEISIVSGGGQASTAMIEDLIRQLGGVGANGYEIFVLSDYDPSGFAITESFVERCRILGLPIRAVERIGISPNHLTDEEVRRQRFEPPIKNDSHRRWMDAHGIDGRYGLELEAVGGRDEKGEALRRMVVDEIGDRIRVESRRERDRQKAGARVREMAVGSLLHSLTADLKEELDAEALEIIDERPVLRPTAYSHDAIHEGAIEGQCPSVETASEKHKLKKALRERIESGEILIGELLRASGGDRR